MEIQVGWKILSSIFTTTILGDEGVGQSQPCELCGAVLGEEHLDDGDGVHEGRSPY